MPFKLFSDRVVAPRNEVMIVCRLTGWCLVLIAVLTASAEAVVALGTGDRIGIAASDVFTIITGVTPDPYASFAGKVMLWPAWSIIGGCGLFLLAAFRNKKNKSSFIK